MPSSGLLFPIHPRRDDDKRNVSRTCSGKSRFEETDPYAEGLFEHTLAVNLMGVVRLSKACVRRPHPPSR